MSEFKGTPGPWVLGDGWIDKHVSIDADEHGAIALVLSDMEYDYTCSPIIRTAKQIELAANAHLIAAAPELLEALRDLLIRTSEINEFGDDYTFAKAQAAISKALGETK